MKSVVFYFLLIVSFSAFAQTHTETVRACDNSYNVITEKQLDGSTKVTIAKSATEKTDYTIKTTDLSVFANTFRDKFLSLLGDENTCTDAQKTDLLNKGRSLFFAIIQSDTDDNAASIPLAGTLKVKKELFLHSKKIGEDEYKTSGFKFPVQKVQIEFNNGYIENIKAYILVEGETLYFTNIYGIGFSSLTNYKNFPDVDLYESNSSPFNKKSKKSEFFLKLSDLIDYDYNIEVDRRDYSPENKTITVNGGESIRLYKQATNKLFEARIYTDFLGLNDNKPNGLVQVEINKNIQLSTTQRQSPRLLFPFFKSYGAFQFISPNVTISKIEQHNRHLILSDLDSLRKNPGVNDPSLLNPSKHRFATALNLYQYQSFSAGFDLNILNLTNHDLKYNFNLNFGLKLGITPITDSLTQKDAAGVYVKTGFVNDHMVNTIQIAPKAIINFLPEERFNFSISNTLLWLKSVGNDFELLSFDKTTNQKIVFPVKSWLNTIELQMAIQVNSISKLFGRIKFISELHNYNNNFSQIQIGYSTYILGNK